MLEGDLLFLMLPLCGNNTFPQWATATLLSVELKIHYLSFYLKVVIIPMDLSRNAANHIRLWRIMLGKKWVTISSQHQYLHSCSCPCSPLPFGLWSQGQTYSSTLGMVYAKDLPCKGSKGWVRDPYDLFLHSLSTKNNVAKSRVFED